jgi:FixJ family two-component response regulator
VGLIRSLGYASRDFACAEDFLRWGDPDQFACIITDIQLPGMSGIELKWHLVKHQCLRPVIMITARADPELDRQVIASGASCFLRKPFQTQTLIDCIDKALNR